VLDQSTDAERTRGGGRAGLIIGEAEGGKAETVALLGEVGQQAMSLVVDRGNLAGHSITSHDPTLILVDPTLIRRDPTLNRHDPTLVFSASDTGHEASGSITELTSSLRGRVWVSS
jgi:hypothetical protein